MYGFSEIAISRIQSICVVFLYLLHSAGFRGPLMKTILLMPRSYILLHRESSFTSLIQKG